MSIQQKLESSTVLALVYLSVNIRMAGSDTERVRLKWSQIAVGMLALIGTCHGLRSMLICALYVLWHISGEFQRFAYANVTSSCNPSKVVHWDNLPHPDPFLFPELSLLYIPLLLNFGLTKRIAKINYRIGTYAARLISLVCLDCTHACWYNTAKNTLNVIVHMTPSQCFAEPFYS